LHRQVSGWDRSDIFLLWFFIIVAFVRPEADYRSEDTLMQRHIIIACSRREIEHAWPAADIQGILLHQKI
jgi:hypothetical protein